MTSCRSRFVLSFHNENTGVCRSWERSGMKYQFVLWGIGSPVPACTGQCLGLTFKQSRIEGIHVSANETHHAKVTVSWVDEDIKVAGYDCRRNFQCQMSSCRYKVIADTLCCLTGRVNLQSSGIFFNWFTACARHSMPSYAISSTASSPVLIAPSIKPCQSARCSPAKCVCICERRSTGITSNHCPLP